MTCQSLLVSIIVLSFSLVAMGGAGISTTAGQYSASNALVLAGQTSPTFYYSNVSATLDGTNTYYIAANGGACSTAINPLCVPTAVPNFFISAIDSVAISNTPQFRIVYAPAAIPAVGSILTGVITSWAYAGVNILTPSIPISWPNLCAAVNAVNSSAGIDVNCQQNGTDPTAAVTLPLYLIADANGNNTLDSGESVLPFTIVFQSTIPAKSDNTTQEGFYQFQTFPGDGECVVINTAADTNFSSTAENGNVGAQFVRFFYTTSSADVYTGFDVTVFNNIVIPPPAGQPHVDLTLDGSVPPNLQPNSLIEGLSNGTNYYFKAAIVDNAGNIGYVTPQGQDQVTSIPLKGAPIVVASHACQPGQVAGLLSKNGTCFIATAAYGSPLAHEVQIFREFRDRILMKTRSGQRFIRWYYHYGASYADRMRTHDTIRALVRAGLYPLLGFSWLALKIGAYNACLLIVTVLLLPFLFFKFLSFKRRDDEMPA